MVYTALLQPAWRTVERGRAGGGADWGQARYVAVAAAAALSFQHAERHPHLRDRRCRQGSANDPSALVAASPESRRGGARGAAQTRVGLRERLPRYPARTIRRSLERTARRRSRVVNACVPVFYCSFWRTRSSTAIDGKRTTSCCAPVVNRICCISPSDDGPASAPACVKASAWEHPCAAASPRLPSDRRVNAAEGRLRRLASAWRFDPFQSLEGAIVDDEPVARRGLRRQLGQLAGNVRGECGGRDGLSRPLSNNGGRRASTCSSARRPRSRSSKRVDAFVVFVTAYHRHAVKRRVHALTTFSNQSPARPRSAERAASLLSLQRGASLADRLEGLLAQRSPRRPDSRDTARGTPRRRDADRLAFLGSRDRLVRAPELHVRVLALVARTSCAPPWIAWPRGSRRDTFIRVRRSALISVRVATLERHGRARSSHLRNGTKVISSRYQPALPTARGRNAGGAVVLTIP